MNVYPDLFVKHVSVLCHTYNTFCHAGCVYIYILVYIHISMLFYVVL